MNDHSRPTSADVKFEWSYTSAHALLCTAWTGTNVRFVQVMVTRL